MITVVMIQETISFPQANEDDNDVPFEYSGRENSTGASAANTDYNPWYTQYKRRSYTTHTEQSSATVSRPVGAYYTKHGGSPSFPNNTKPESRDSGPRNNSSRSPWKVPFHTGRELLLESGINSELFYDA
jgi:hypothetical protein